jgi:histidine triad (HIT) family protein
MSEANCLFCRIASRAIPAEIVGEDDGLLAFKDINPQAPTHLLIIPTEHIRTLADISDIHTDMLGRTVRFANRLAREHGLADAGYRLVANCGAEAGQTVWHLHFHLLGGRSMRWPPG